MGSPRRRGRFSGLLPEGFSLGRTKRNISAGKHWRPCRRFSHIHVAHPSPTQASRSPADYAIFAVFTRRGEPVPSRSGR